MSRRLQLLLVPAVALVAGCGSLDTGEGEDAIKSDIEKGTGAEAVKVDCPPDVEQKKGENFKCTATVDGQKVNVPVTQTDDDSHVEFLPELVKTREVEQTIETRIEKETENTSGVEAQCPTVVPLNKGSSFTCDVQTPGPDAKVKATQVNDEGRVDLELER